MADLRRIIDAYDSLLIRAYATVRFRIIDLRFIEEIGQSLPERGRVLDLGCGFGLFALAFGTGRPGRSILGIDLNGARIEKARAAATRLGAENVRFALGDAREAPLDQGFDAVYLLDIVHHVPRAAVEALFAAVRRALPPDGILIVKDVDSRPAYKRLFTWVLDKAMDPRTPVHYWSASDLRALLTRHGFVVHVHQMRDLLPYPHVLYVCRPSAAGPSSAASGEGP